MVQNSETTTWDGAKTTVNSGDKLYQHQLVSQIFEPSTVCVMYIYSFCPYTPKKLEEEQLPTNLIFAVGILWVRKHPHVVDWLISPVLFFHQRHDIQA